MVQSTRVLAIAMGLAISCFTHAATYTIAPVSQGAYTVSHTTFNDRFSFTLPTSSNFKATISNLVNVNTNNISFELFNASNTSLVSLTGTTNGSLSFSATAAVTPGNYYFFITGQGRNGPNVPHSYTLTTLASSTSPLVTPVPEPETWVMMLGGLAVVASSVRRNKFRI